MNPPANWYPDPTGRHGQRYWDGTQWTEHVFTDGVQGVDRLDAAALEGATGAATTSDAGSSSGPDAAEDDEATDSAEPAPLPRRQRREPADAVPADAPMDEPIAGAEELFSTGDDGHSAPDAETWTPDEAAEDDDGGAVAPEVEPEDVVGAVEETTEPSAPDFSDAFVLAPETASRLVSRTARPDEAALDEPEDADADPGPAPGDEVADGDPAPAAATPVIDAPPPTMPAPAPGTSVGLGITGDLVGGAFAERDDDGPVALQNNRMLRCAASGGIIARQGTMVAYQGDVSFERQGAGGVGRALKRAATGEGLAMMRVAGNGDVFFADAGQHVFLLHLDGGPGLSVNGRNVLAFSASLQWDIERVKGASLVAGGLFNTTLTGSGWVALVSDGEPVVLRTDEAPTYVDVNALVAWSGGLSTRITNTISAKSLVGLGSGEAFQMAFDGTGIVIVQPSEGPMAGPAAT